MFVADNGIDWALSCAPDTRIPKIHLELRKLKGSDFEVVTAPVGDVCAEVKFLSLPPGEGPGVRGTAALRIRGLARKRGEMQVPLERLHAIRTERFARYSFLGCGVGRNRFAAHAALQQGFAKRRRFR